MHCACAEKICRRGSISKNHQLTNINKCGKFHACIRNSTILALSGLANFAEFGISLIQRKHNSLLRSTVLILYDEGAGLMAVSIAIEMFHSTLFF